MLGFRLVSRYGLAIRMSYVVGGVLVVMRVVIRGEGGDGVSLGAFIPP